MKWETLARIAEARRMRRRVVVVTHCLDGAQCVLDSESSSGELVLTSAQLREARQLLSSGSSALFGDPMLLFARVYEPSPRLLIVGAVHIAQALSQIAQTGGYEVVVVDPRTGFASADRFPGITLEQDWPDEAIARLGVDETTALVVLTHDPKLDDPALELALNSKAFYVGALGSRRTHEKRLARLRALGLGSQLNRIHAPIGLDLGGRAPAEIAVAILAEVIQTRHRNASK